MNKHTYFPVAAFSANAI